MNFLTVFVLLAFSVNYRLQKGPKNVVSKRLLSDKSRKNWTIIGWKEEGRSFAGISEVS